MPQVSQTAILPTSVQHDPSTLILQVLPRTNKKLQNFRKSPTPSDIVGTIVNHFVFKYHCEQVKNSNASSITTIILSTSVQHDPSTLILQVLPRTNKKLQNFRKSPTPSDIVGTNVKHFVFKYHCKQVKNSNASSITTIILSTSVQHDP